MARTPAPTTKPTFEDQSHLYLLMHLAAAPFDGDGGIVLEDTRPTLDFGPENNSIATFKGKGPNSTEAFEAAFSSGADVEDSALYEFIGDTFDVTGNIFVWVFNTTSKAWWYLGEIKAERTYKLG